MIAMLCFPESMRKAQAEIDRVVGRDRLPTFADFDHMPYVRAMVKETLRWRGVGPLDVPHRLCQDDVYEGYWIPKDTTCIVNAWALNHDQDIYGPDAEDFNPGRFIDEKTGDLKPAIADTKDEGHVSYGFGRRICVGRHISNYSMYIEIAALLWCFDILPSKDAAGKPIIPDPLDSVDEGLVVYVDLVYCHSILL
jgi:cytochrome P450